MNGQKNAYLYVFVYATCTAYTRIEIYDKVNRDLACIDVDFGRMDIKKYDENESEKKVSDRSD